jgi:hypothetical protein
LWSVYPRREAKAEPPEVWAGACTLTVPAHAQRKTRKAPAVCLGSAKVTHPLCVFVCVCVYVLKAIMTKQLSPAWGRVQASSTHSACVRCRCMHA